ncbi:MAG: hypothetical protein CL489_06460 [Acidobacteria bacterium]|nr:hypothetical protein [Acidobacteriota bacterium]|tara:strand:+ start:67537 stop:67755 length:219 start_codon:yes stop_codon:yes gene_type:complete
MLDLDGTVNQLENKLVETWRKYKDLPEVLKVKFRREYYQKRGYYGRAVLVAFKELDKFYEKGKLIHDRIEEN